MTEKPQPKPAPDFKPGDKDIWEAVEIVLRRRLADGTLKIVQGRLTSGR